MKSIVLVAVAAVAALLVIGGAGARSGDVAATLGPGNGVLYHNLGCEYLGAGSDAALLCGVWNYKGLVPGSYAFQINAGWAVQLEQTTTGLKVLSASPQPGSSAPQPAVPATVPSILSTKPARLTNGDQFATAGLGVEGNDVLAQDETTPVLGVFPYSGSVPDGGIVMAVSGIDLNVSTFVKGQGTKTDVDVKQPSLTPYLDQAEGNIDLAISLEKQALAALGNGEPRKAHRLVVDSKSALNDAADEVDAANVTGETRGDKTASDINLKLIAAADLDHSATTFTVEGKTREKVRLPAIVRRDVGQALSLKDAALKHVRSTKSAAAELR